MKASERNEHIESIARVFLKHAREIRREARRAPRGWYVLAEVEPDGRYAGAGAVPPGTGSAVALRGGYALYLRANPETTLDDVELAVADWLDQQKYILRGCEIEEDLAGIPLAVDPA